MKSLLQTPEWANLKVSQGWKSHEVDGVFVLEKRLPLGRSFLYAPEVSWEAITNLQNLLQILQKNIKQSGTIFFRLEIIDEKNDEIIKNLQKNKFIKAFEELQPEWRQIIDISKTEEEILAQMKPKGRYNIKVAQKHRVEATVCPIDHLHEGIEIFYNLYLSTAGHQKISHRDKDYFLQMMKTLYPKGEAAIIIARYNNLPLSAIIVTFYDKVASYLYGGTSREHKNVMAPYAAHWQAIRLAKEKGCQKYDLLAVTPADSLQPTANSTGEAVSRKPLAVSHRYANITFFKEQFGGKKVNICGSWDMVYKPKWYKIFKMAERLRRR